MITMKKSEDGKEFLMTDGESVLGRCCFIQEKGEILDYDIKDPAFEFVFVNLTKAVLNFFDLNGIKTVKYYGNTNQELLIKQGFIQNNDALSLNLEGYFNKKCCGQENR